MSKTTKRRSTKFDNDSTNNNIIKSRSKIKKEAFKIQHDIDDDNWIDFVADQENKDMTHKYQWPDFNFKYSE